ncbi:peptidoglycan DD-metalloendopeptidase family protein [Permianibacter sp. IMCC34836]|uniref:peptidoglycan DD-metalloendopeptidase family protein n=1 Tax=Permianibacter fluminis TaxID=2738515 RepID=UPI001556F495|nr:peptidoglycan DD-metalloendopeptidase family protein [Permianibacter fluminis]NQD37086.1 peptidoglycan DD-metalloendopeptidase family protein [Permianibacter fluminis]
MQAFRKPVAITVFAGVATLLAGCLPPPMAPFESRLIAQEQAIDRGYHVVAAGETLYSIAFAYDLDFRTLARWNGVDTDYRIFPGQRLKLSGPKLPIGTYERQSSDENVKISTAEPPPKAVELPSVRPSNSSTNPPKASPTAPISAAKPGTNKPLADVQKDTKTPVNPQENRTSPGVANGPIKWSWPAPGKLLAGFSASPTGNKGVNIAGHSGEPVKAAASGRVVYAGNGLRGFGQLVIVKHDDDFLSAYAHNSRLHVKENDSVKAGQLIADIGSTGTDVEQLHFEIRYQGQPVDPLKHLPKR